MVLIRGSSTPRVGPHKAPVSRGTSRLRHPQSWPRAHEHRPSSRRVSAVAPEARHRFWTSGGVGAPSLRIWPASVVRIRLWTSGGRRWPASVQSSRSQGLFGHLLAQEEDGFLLLQDRDLPASTLWRSVQPVCGPPLIRALGGLSTQRPASARGQTGLQVMPRT